MLDARDSNRRRVQLISNINFARGREVSGPGARVPSAGPWVECDDGMLFRMVYVPMICERAPYSGEVPCCPACHAPYRRHDYHNRWVLFKSVCLEVHADAREGDFPRKEETSGQIQ